MQTDSLLGSRDLRKWVGYLHEGDLSTLRSAMGSNERLKEAAKTLGLDKFILTVPLGRGQWCPVSLEMCTKDGLSEEIEEKEEKKLKSNQFIPSSKGKWNCIVCSNLIILFYNQNLTMFHTLNHESLR